MPRLELDKGEAVFVRIPIPSSDAAESYKIKKGTVVSTAARAAKIQVEGEPPDKPRHITWSKISRTADGFKSNGRSDPAINKPRLTKKVPREKPADLAPKETEPELSGEIKALDQDLSDWVSMGDDLAGALKVELVTKDDDRQRLRAEIAEQQARLEGLDQEVRTINRRIEKLSAIQKMMVEE